MLTTNFKILNGQTETVKHFDITDNKVSSIYIKFNDLNVGIKLITTNNFGRITNSVPIKASIFVRKSNMVSAIIRT